MSTPAVLLLSDPETERLVTLARRGRRSARRRLHRRLRGPLYPLAYAWTGHPWSATRAIRSAITTGLTDTGRPYGSAVVAALHRHTSRVRDGQEVAERSSALDRAVLVLCDGNRLSRSAAASLLGLPAAAVAEHHRAGRAALGLPVEDSDVPRCAGWALASREAADLTAAEQSAAQGHLKLCRRCRDGLAARRRTRTALQATGALSGGGAAAAAAVAIEGLLASAGTATVAGGIGVVGGLGVLGGLNGGHLPAHVPFGTHASRPAAPSSGAAGAAPSARSAAARAKRSGGPASPSRTPGHAPPNAPAQPSPQASTSPQPGNPPPAQPSKAGSVTLPPLPTVTVPGVTLPSLPGLPLPTVSLPPVTLPTVTLPPVGLPSTTLPGLTLPGLTLPGATLPLPSVSLLNVSASGLSPTSLTIPLPTIGLPVHSAR